MRTKFGVAAVASLALLASLVGGSFANAAKPNETGKPAETGKPIEVGKPVEIGKPADTGKDFVNVKTDSATGKPLNVEGKASFGGAISCRRRIMSILDVGAASLKPSIASCNDPPSCTDGLVSKSAAKLGAQHFNQLGAFRRVQTEQKLPLLRPVGTLRSCRK